MTGPAFTVQEHDPALSVIAQANRLPTIIQEEKDLGIRRAEVTRMIGHCHALLLFWERQ